MNHDTNNDQPQLMAAQAAARAKRAHGPDTDLGTADPIPHKRQHLDEVHDEEHQPVAVAATVRHPDTSTIVDSGHSRHLPWEPHAAPAMQVAPSAAGSSVAAETPAIHTTVVYRSCDTQQPWDAFQPNTDPATASTFPHTLHSSGTRATATIHSMKDHVVMKWDQLAPSPYISLHRNRSWAIFNQFEHEYRCGVLGSSPRYRAACTPWTLFALQVATDDLSPFSGNYPLARNMAHLADTQFGYLHVRVARHAQVVLPAGLREASVEWFETQFEQACAKAASTGKPVAPRYPYRQWLAHIMALDHGKAWLEYQLVDPAALWAAGKTDAQVEEAVKSALVQHPIPAWAVDPNVKLPHHALHHASAAAGKKKTSRRARRRHMTDAQFFGMSEAEYQRCKEFLVSREEIEALFALGGGGSSCGCASDHNGACMGPPPFH